MKILQENRQNLMIIAIVIAVIVIQGEFASSVIKYYQLIFQSVSSNVLVLTKKNFENFSSFKRMYSLRQRICEAYFELNCPLDLHSRVT